MKAKQYRAIEVGSNRANIFQMAVGRYNEAMKQGFYLEAITIVESFLADRMESRSAYLKNEPQEFSTLGKLSEYLKGNKQGESDFLKEVYAEIFAWADKRNKALHQVVKIEEGTFKDWDEFYKGNEKVAYDGMKLFRKLDNALAKQKREEEKLKAL